MDGSYRVLLARGASQQLIVALSLAWLSFGMVSLAILLTAHRASGSYGIAGVTVAAFAVGSGVLAPLRGRLLDRRGARPWLPAFASGYAIALLAFAGLARAGAGSWALSLCAAVAGASVPPLVASIRPLWPRLVEQALVRRAYTLTSVVGDVGVAAAPALGGLLFVIVSWLPLVICAISAVAAALIVARVSAPAVAPEATAEMTAPLLTGPLRILLAVEVALGVALGFIEVAVPAAATRRGETRFSGFLLGAFALGSVAGGIWFGQRDWKSPPHRRYLLAVLLLALALAAPIAATGAATLAALLIISGLAYGPATISLFEALDALDTSRATEALTWITTAGAIGAAAGSAASGWAIGSIGQWAPFAAASLTLAVAAALGLLRTNGIRPA
jgi:MFS family permease